MSFLPYFTTETWTLIATVLFLIILYGYAPYGFFKKLGINGPKPLPFLGTFLEYRKGIQEFDIACYKKYGKIWGFYEGRQPIMGVMDRTMIKAVLVKECYSVFTNRRDIGLNGQLRDTVTFAEDEDWKRIRSVLSPSFTSGRLKEMFKIMKQHSSNLMKSLEKKVDAGQVFDVKEIFGPYSMDVVTSTAFSVDIDSINHPTDPFVTNIKKLATFEFFNPLLLIVGPILEKFEFSIFPTHVMDFFYTFLKQIKADRSKNIHNSRVDFMQLMVDSQISDKTTEGPNSQIGLTDHEILSQAMTFIFAGYETSSSTLGFLAYNLATNPDIQTALQKEIDQTFPNKAVVTYESLLQMEYLDMVLNESQRLFPIAIRLERMAKKTVELNGVTIPKGTNVMIPLYTLHHDPAIWPDPEAFKPERFSKENKDNFDPYAYLPFGVGPRNCIGMRFAIILMKLAVVEILRDFTFVTCKETEMPLQLGNEGLLKPKNPIKLKLVRRN